jgi:hypothetical protein
VQQAFSAAFSKLASVFEALQQGVWAVVFTSAQQPTGVSACWEKTVFSSAGIFSFFIFEKILN